MLIKAGTYKFNKKLKYDDTVIGKHYSVNFSYTDTIDTTGNDIGLPDGEHTFTYYVNGVHLDTSSDDSKPLVHFYFSKTLMDGIQIDDGTLLPRMAVYDDLYDTGWGEKVPTAIIETDQIVDGDFYSVFVKNTNYLMVNGLGTIKTGQYKFKDKLEYASEKDFIVNFAYSQTLDTTGNEMGLPDGEHTFIFYVHRVFFGLNTYTNKRYVEFYFSKILMDGVQIDDGTLVPYTTVYDEYNSVPWSEAQAITIDINQTVTKEDYNWFNDSVEPYGTDYLIKESTLVGIADEYRTILGVYDGIAPKDFKPRAHDIYQKGYETGVAEGGSSSAKPTLWGSYPLGLVTKKPDIQKSYSIEGMNMWFYSEDQWVYERISEILVSAGAIEIYSAESGAYNVYSLEGNYWADGDEMFMDHERLRVIDVPYAIAVSQEFYTLFSSMVNFTFNPFELGFDCGAREG